VTLDAWLAARTPAPPPRLIVRLREVVGERTGEDGGDVVQICLDAADALLLQLLARPSAGRESALDLLTVDSLVTYAFEAAAEQPQTLGSRAAQAMMRLAAAAR
jgi:hypothetical protein